MRTALEDFEVGRRLFLCQEIFYLVFVHHLLLEGVGTRLGAAHRLDHFGIVLGFGRLFGVLFNRRFCCFCHGYEL